MEGDKDTEKIRNAKKSVFAICPLVLGEGYIVYKMLCSYFDFMDVYGDTLGKTAAGKIVFFAPYSIAFTAILACIILLVKKFLRSERVGKKREI